MIYLELDDQQAELVEKILRDWHDKTWGTGKDTDGIAMPGNNTEAVKKVLAQFDNPLDEDELLDRLDDEVIENYYKENIR